jgi:hypothetical protein
MMPYCRMMTHEAIKRQLDEAPRFARNLGELLMEFDEEYYVETNGDVKAAVANSSLGSGRHHYIAHGFAEYRAPFALHAPWYTDQYPMAALEVAQGDYADLHHHYVAIGKSRGYQRVP